MKKENARNGQIVRNKNGSFDLGVLQINSNWLPTLTRYAETELSFRWENLNTRRYYQVVLSKDLFAQWVVVKTWGGINKAGGRIVLIACDNYQEAIKVIDSIFKVRKRHGYQLRAEVRA